jgi:2-keto-4-pentenoate hydratase
MNVQDKTNILYNNCKNLISYESDSSIEIKNIDEAYLIQDSFISLKTKEGYGDIAGWKVALTNPEMQKLVGVKNPVEGAILRPLIYKNNASLKLEEYCHLGAEAEIALKIHKDIPSKINGFNNKEEIMPYLKEVMVAIEIVDDRNYGANITFEKLIAQNSMNYGCVIGDSVEIDLMTLDKLEGELIVSGNIFGRGKGKNVLQHPLNSVLYLVNNLIKRGRKLYSGDIILTGSISTTCWPNNGDKVEAHIDKLNTVSMNIF